MIRSDERARRKRLVARGWLPDAMIKRAESLVSRGALQYWHYIVAQQLQMQLQRRQRFQLYLSRANYVARVQELTRYLVL